MTPSAVTQRFGSICLAAFAANALCAGVLPSASGKVVALAGATLAAAVFIAVYTSQRLRNSLVVNPPAIVTRRVALPLITVAFVAPLVFLRWTPTFAFWHFDGRAALLSAWLLVTTVALVLEYRRADVPNDTAIRCLLVLFIFFSAGVWLSVVMDTGIASFMATIDRRAPRPCQADPFAEMASVWESHPASAHLFLAWRSEDSFNRHIVYANHVHPYLLTMYGWIRAARRIGGLTLWQGSNTSLLLPVLVLIGAFATLLARSGLLWHRASLRDLVALFLTVAILVTTWRLWFDLVRFNSDNPYPLLAGILILVYACLLPPMRTGAAAVAAASFAAFSPTNTPMLILPTLCLFAHGKRNWQEFVRSNRPVLIVCGAALIVGALSYVEPRLLMKWKGYHTQESSFLFRSGLDGDTRYFTGLLQAAALPCPVNCCYTRSLPDLLFPAVVPLALFLPWMLWLERTSAVMLGRTLLFLLTPYVMSVILFPQSVSIHPYQYDHWLVVPLVVTGLMAMLSAPVERRLKGAALLVFLLIAGGVLMSNLLGITQGLARAIAYFTS